MTLAERVALHRDLYGDDLWIEQLATTQPPTTLDPRSGELHVEDASHLGMTLSGPLLRRLGHPEGYGSLFPWTKALWKARHWCRAQHPYHRGHDKPYWRGALCHQAVRLVVIGIRAPEGPLSVEMAAAVLRYDDLGSILSAALQYIEDAMDDARARDEQREKQDAGVFHAAERPPVAQRHDQPGLHQQECPICRRNAA